jgi:DNA polymerase-1
MADNPTLYIVDGSAYVYRAFFGIRSKLSNSSGMPTNALYGFMKMLRGLIEREDPDYLAVTFDRYDEEDDGKSFRHALYSDYKANRDSMPDDLRVQVPYFLKLVEAMNIPVLLESGVEADDVIATFTKQALEADLDVCVVSADKDLMQLIGPRVRMIDTMRDKVFDEQSVLDRFGVTPDKIKYVLALAGDTSDNIPGVPGIGEKTGGKLIDEFGDLENLLDNIDKVSGKKRKENLTEYADQARLSLELVTLKEDCDVTFDKDALLVSPPNLSELSDLLVELEFHAMLRSFKKWFEARGWLTQAAAQPAAVASSATKQTPAASGSGQLQLFGAAAPAASAQAANPIAGTLFDTPDKTYETISTWEQFDEVVKELEAAELYGFDLETTSVDAMSAEIVGLSFAWKDDHGVYIPVAHDYEDVPQQLPRDEVLARLKPMLEDPTRKKVGQHIKYEWLVLQNYGIDYAGVRWDTMLMSYLLEPSKPSHSLDALAMDHLSYGMTSYEDVAGKGKKQITFDKVTIDVATDYAAEDADIALMLARVLAPKMEEAELTKMYEELELPLTHVLGKMERAGVRVDRTILDKLSAEFETELEDLQTQINAFKTPADEDDTSDLNPNSPKQLREVLFDQLGLPVKKTTKSGPSTDQSVLEQLAPLHPLPDLILEYRSFSKLKSTYVDALPELMRPDTGRVHTSFNQAVAATGRLSSSNPNLQNIPIRTARGRTIRSAFVPKEGWTMLVADYSQIELRIMTHLSKEPTMLAAYQGGEDIHARTAAGIFDVDISEVTKEQRSAGKCVHPDTLVYVNGELQRIQLLNASRHDTFEDVYEKTTQDGEGNAISITQSYNGGIKDLYHVVTRRGVLTCTARHAFKTADGGLAHIEDGSLVEGTTLAESIVPLIEDRPYPKVAYKAHKDAPQTWIHPSHMLSYACGVFLGDGTKSSHAVAITHGDVDKDDAHGIPYQRWQDELNRVFSLLGFNPRRKKDTLYLGSRNVTKYFVGLGVVEGVRRGGRRFRIPDWILSAGPTAIKHFIAGLADTDGAIRSGGLAICTKDEMFAGDIAMACRAAGMNVTISSTLNKTYDRYYYRVRLSKADTWSLRGFLRHPGKTSHLEEPKSKAAFARKPNEVLNIIPAGAHECLDLSVDTPEHLYLANGLITHNTINFGILYGMGTQRLANQLKITMSDAKEYMTNYFKRFGHIQDFLEGLIEEARLTGEATTMFGRRRSIPDINAKGARRAFAERVAMNTPIQGTAADIIKMAMIDIQQRIEDDELPMRMLLQVHDELVFEVAPEFAEEARALVLDRMENIVELDVPLKVDGDLGDNWLEAK